MVKSACCAKRKSMRARPAVVVEFAPPRSAEGSAAADALPDRVVLGWATGGAVGLR